MGTISGIKYLSIALIVAGIVGFFDKGLEKRLGFGTSKTIWAGVGLALTGIGVKTTSKNIANVGGGVLMFDVMDIMYELTRYL